MKQQPPPREEYDPTSPAFLSLLGINTRLCALKEGIRARRFGVRSRGEVGVEKSWADRVSTRGNASVGASIWISECAKLL